MSNKQITQNDPDDHGGVIQPISIPDHAAACGPSDGYDVLLRPRYPFRATPPSVEPRASLDLFVAVSIPRCPASTHQPGPLKLRMCRELAPAELARWSDDYALQRKSQGLPLPAELARWKQ